MGKTRMKNLKREVEIVLLSKALYQQYQNVIRLHSKGIPKKEACMKVGIARSKFYYWHRNVIQILKLRVPGSHISANDFRAISSKPHHSPRQITKEQESLIVKIRKKTNQGAEHIQYQLRINYGLNLSITCIYKCLKRNGLIRERKYHQKKKAVVIKRDYKPGEKIQVDTKYVKMKTGKTVYQYSAIDMATGIIFKWLYEGIGPDQSCDFLRKLVRFYPFEIQKIQTDNGFEYTWRLNPEIRKIHHFTLQCQLLHLEHVLIPPASPTFNSKVERTHRIDKQELWNKTRFTSFKSMKKALRHYVHQFNHFRKTKSKNWLAPLHYANLYFGLNITLLHQPVQYV